MKVSLGAASPASRAFTPRLPSKTFTRHDVGLKILPQSYNGASPVPPSLESQTAPVPSTSSRPIERRITYRVSFFDAMKFLGPAPERINARLAMAMLIPAAQREMATSETLMQQFASPDWLVAVAALVIIYASMVPILKGCKDEDFYWFSVRAEKVNGRLAMLAWAGLLGLEYLADGACFF